MGGYYHSSSTPQRRTAPPPVVPQYKKLLKTFFEEGDREDLVLAYNEFMKTNSSGFFKELLSVQDVAETPKEFPEVEYEVKLNILMNGPSSKTEPGLDEMLDGFEFPPTKNARFLKDPVNAVSQGCNYFYGQDDEETLVVISKGGKTYLKEKGPVTSLSTKIPFQELVMKRTETRYPASVDDVLKKTNAVMAAGSTLAGYINKEKGEAFVLDTNDGRIYSFVISRAARQDGVLQRQLELEYAGHIPGFEGKSEQESEAEIVTGMVDLAKYLLLLHHTVPLDNGWKMRIAPTQERKYDFVRGAPAAASPSLDFGNHLNQLPTDLNLEEDASIRRFRNLDLSGDSSVSNPKDGRTQMEEHFRQIDMS